MSNKGWQPVEASGTPPLPSFGHTVTPIAKTKVVLFGGATGESGKFAMTGDTYLFNLYRTEWTKVQGNRA